MSAEALRRPVFACAIACAWFASAAACGRDSTERDAARALVDRIASLDLHAPAEARARQLDALRSLALPLADLRDARDRCALAHGGLLTAELQQSNVRARLDRAGSEPLGAQELPLLRDALARASSDLSEARAALPACANAVQLAMRRLR